MVSSVAIPLEKFGERPGTVIGRGKKREFRKRRGKGQCLGGEGGRQNSPPERKGRPLERRDMLQQMGGGYLSGVWVGQALKIAGSAAKRVGENAESGAD